MKKNQLDCPICDEGDRVQIIFGQISAKHKLSAQDIRQLAEVGIPAFDILQRKLGLTADQVFNIGRANISSIAGIKALREGMRELYGTEQSIPRGGSNMRALLSAVREWWDTLYCTLFHRKSHRRFVMYFYPRRRYCNECLRDWKV